MYVGARYPDILFHFKIFTPLHHLRHLIETLYDSGIGRSNIKYNAFPHPLKVKGS